ncbi:hypothetical protein HanLR1_Chr01g0017551 [Helianthus annuus]|nr:hypothetical protein HanLR1_Chr01g0017551 [Helianthus annuus]
MNRHFDAFDNQHLLHRTYHQHLLHRIITTPKSKIKSNQTRIISSTAPTTSTSSTVSTLVSLFLNINRDGGWWVFV